MLGLFFNFRLNIWLLHGWIFDRLKFAICEQVHLLADPGLYNLQLVLLDELSEWIDLLLVEESDEVVAEAAHLGISVQ